MKHLSETVANIGKVILNERKRQQLTRAQLAEISELSIQTIAKVENGATSNFKIETFLSLVNSLNLSADYVLGIKQKGDEFEAELQTLSPAQKKFILSEIKNLREYDSSR